MKKFQDADEQEADEEEDEEKWTNPAENKDAYAK
jgi:hypothetical protein